MDKDLSYINKGGEMIKIKAYDEHKLLLCIAKFNRSQKYYTHIVYYGFGFFKRISAKPTPQK